MLTNRFPRYERGKTMSRCKPLPTCVLDHVPGQFEDASSDEDLLGPSQDENFQFADADDARDRLLLEGEVDAGISSGSSRYVNGRVEDASARCYVRKNYLNNSPSYSADVGDDLANSKGSSYSSTVCDPQYQKRNQGSPQEGMVCYVREDTSVSENNDAESSCTTTYDHKHNRATPITNTDVFEEEASSLRTCSFPSDAKRVSRNSLRGQFASPTSPKSKDSEPPSIIAESKLRNRFLLPKMESGSIHNLANLVCFYQQQAKTLEKNRTTNSNESTYQLADARSVQNALSIVKLQNLPPGVRPILRGGSLDGMTLRSYFVGVNRCKTKWQASISFLGIHRLGTCNSEWDAGCLHAWAYEIIHGRSSMKNMVLADQKLKTPVNLTTTTPSRSHGCPTAETKTTGGKVAKATSYKNPSPRIESVPMTTKFPNVHERKAKSASKAESKAINVDAKESSQKRSQILQHDASQIISSPVSQYHNRHEPHINLLGLKHPSAKIIPKSNFEPLPIHDFVSRDEDRVNPISRPENRDVLLGRGGFSNYHAGNRWYRELVGHYRSSYGDLSKFNKIQLARNLLNYIRLVGGRFLLERKKTIKGRTAFYECGDDRALSKVQQSLRQEVKIFNGYHSLKRNAVQVHENLSRETKKARAESADAFDAPIQHKQVPDETHATQGVEMVNLESKHENIVTCRSESSFHNPKARAVSDDTGVVCNVRKNDEVTPQANTLHYTLHFPKTDSNMKMSFENDDVLLI